MINKLSFFEAPTRIELVSKVSCIHEIDNKNQNSFIYIRNFYIFAKILIIAKIKKHDSIQTRLY